MRYFINAFLRLRYSMKPGLRDGIDAMGIFFAITLVFLLTASFLDWKHTRHREFDGSAWWNVGIIGQIIRMI